MQANNKIAQIMGHDIRSFMLDQQNRAFEAATVTLCYFTALCLPMGKMWEISVFIFSQDQEFSREII